MCTGRPPFRAPTTLAVLKRVAEDSPRPIREIIPEVPRWLCDLITRLHAKKPADRIATAREVADLLERGPAARPSPGNGPPAAEESPPQLRDAPEAAQALPASRFRLGRWAAAGAGLLLLLGGLSITEATGVTDVRGTVFRLFSPEGTPMGAANNGRQVAQVSQEPGTVTKAAAEKKNPDRQAAEYVLSIGGGVRIDIDGRERSIHAATELPAGTVRLTWVALAANKQVTDDGLAVFKDCEDLPQLELAFSTQVTDAGVSCFKKCKNLVYLNLTGTQVTDAGLAHFKGCTKLDFLVLDRTQVTDVGLAYFQDCKRLTWLQLSEMPRVTDAGLAIFKDCKNLKRLRLNHTPITDAGLAHLAGMDQLIELRITRTQVTAKGVEELAKALPRCKITWDGAIPPD
jgi:hypothetical protein